MIIFFCCCCLLPPHELKQVGDDDAMFFVSFLSCVKNKSVVVVDASDFWARGDILSITRRAARPMCLTLLLQWCWRPRLVQRMDGCWLVHHAIWCNRQFTPSDALYLIPAAGNKAAVMYSAITIDLLSAAIDGRLSRLRLKYAAVQCRCG